MNELGKSRFSPSQIFAHLRLFVLAAIAFALGLTLYAWRPIWLIPPSHAYTLILYWLLAQAWIPLWCYAIWRLPQRRLLALLLSMLLCLPMTCLVSLTFVPQTNFELLSMKNEDYGSLRYGGLNEQHCSLQDKIFTCELAQGSSDNDRATYYSYRFELIDHLPLMRLVNLEARVDCNPGYVTCPRHDVP